jgi:hypothetical protein
METASYSVRPIGIVRSPQPRHRNTCDQPCLDAAPCPAVVPVLLVQAASAKPNRIFTPSERALA